MRFFFSIPKKVQLFYETLDTLIKALTAYLQSDRLSFVDIQARSVLELQVCSYRLNMGQDQLNVALTM